MRIISKNIWRLYWKLRTLFTQKGIEDGFIVPDFQLFHLRGEKVSLYSFYPERCLILWLTNFCSICEEKIPFLEELRRKFGNRIQILAISVLGEDRETPTRVADKYNISFHLLLDPQDWVGKVLRFPHPPETCPLFNLLVLDRFGKVAFRSHLSAVKEEKLVEVLGSLLKARN